MCSVLPKVQVKSHIRLLKVNSPLAGSLDDFFCSSYLFNNASMHISPLLLIVNMHFNMSSFPSPTFANFFFQYKKAKAFPRAHAARHPAFILS